MLCQGGRHLGSMSAVHKDHSAGSENSSFVQRSVARTMESFEHWPDGKARRHRHGQKTQYPQRAKTRGHCQANHVS